MQCGCNVVRADLCLVVAEGCAGPVGARGRAVTPRALTHAPPPPPRRPRKPGGRRPRLGRAQRVSRCPRPPPPPAGRPWARRHSLWRPSTLGARAPWRRARAGRWASRRGASWEWTGGVRVGAGWWTRFTKGGIGAGRHLGRVSPRRGPRRLGRARPRRPARPPGCPSPDIPVAWRDAAVGAAPRHTRLLQPETAATKKQRP